MASSGVTSESVNTNWEASAGDFACSVCNRKRLPASEFSQNQVKKALASSAAIKEKDIREDVITRLFVTAVCKKCMEAREAKEREEAQKKREEAEATAEHRADLEQQQLAAGEEVIVTLTSKPFGVAAAKSEHVQGFLVAKVTEGKPAANAGVRPGWRLLEVAGEDCREKPHAEVTELLKAGEIPLKLLFEKLAEDADYCTSCERVLVSELFSRKMRTKPVEKRRCSNCVEGAEADEAAARAEAADATGAAPATPLSELQQLCAESAKQAEKVTGLKPVRGGSFAGRGGKGRGRR